jgi:hypothetical protein
MEKSYPKNQREKLIILSTKREIQKKINENRYYRKTKNTLVGYELAYKL